MQTRVIVISRWGINEGTVSRYRAIVAIFGRKKKNKKRGEEKQKEQLKRPSPYREKRTLYIARTNADSMRADVALYVYTDSNEIAIMVPYNVRTYAFYQAKRGACVCYIICFFESCVKLREWVFSNVSLPTIQNFYISSGEARKWRTRTISDGSFLLSYK